MEFLLLHFIVIAHDDRAAVGASADIDISHITLAMAILRSSIPALIRAAFSPILSITPVR